MTVAFPTTLPTPLAQGYSIRPYETAARAAMDIGGSRARGHNRSGPYSVGVRWLFTDAQLAAFEAWHDDDISQGADEFTARLAGSEGLETVTCRFLGPYSVSKVQQHWGVTAELEVAFTELTLDQYLYLIDPTNFSISLSAGSLSSTSDLDQATQSSATLTVSHSGGAEPITYSWTRLSGFAFTLVNGTDAAAQVFRSAMPGDTASLSATYRVTANDWFGNVDTADVTVSHVWTMPSDPNISNVVLLLHGDGTNGSTTITDNSPGARTVTAHGNAQISTARKKFRTGSILFDGTGDYLSVPVDSGLELRAGAFTVEGWVYLEAFLGVGAALFARMSSTNGIQYEHAFSVAENWLHFYYGIRNTNQGQTRLYYPTPITLNAWHHVAVQRDGSGDWAVYLDGQKGTQYQTSALQGGTGTTFGSITTGTYNNAVDFGSNAIVPSVGGTSIGEVMAQGSFDEIRITKGVARYAGSFTPKQYPFPDS